MRYCAFFDMDETIINCKSMIEVLKYYFETVNSDGCIGINKFDELMQKINTYCDREQPTRERLNEFFYSSFQGLNVASMKNACVNWFNEKGKSLINKSVMEKIEKHQKHDALIMVVTGSFNECARVISDYVGADFLFCNDLETKEGEYTGRLLSQPRIGAEKARIISQFMHENQYSFKGSYAYADHISDLSLLMLAENPTIVGFDKELQEYAKLKNWQQIST